jgi:hypothetical protein
MAATEVNYARYAVFIHALQLLGWTEGRNVHIETRFTKGNAADVHKHAAELVALALPLCARDCVEAPISIATPTTIVATNLPARMLSIASSN